MRKQWQRVLVTVGFVVVFLALCSDPLLMAMAGLRDTFWPQAEEFSMEGRAGGRSPDGSSGGGINEPDAVPDVKDPQAVPPTGERPAVDKPVENPIVEKPAQPSNAPPKHPDQPPARPTGDRQVIYLTFDDGPSPHVTPHVLDMLKKHQVKATFFVIGSEVERFPELAKRILAEGHTLGSHTYSHRFDIIYQSPQHYLDDLRKGEETLRRLLKYETRLTRAPGGSTRFTSEYIQLLNDEGFIYVDWNVDSGDSRSLTVPAATIVANTLRGLEDKQHAVVLMHDMAMKTTAAEALDQMLTELLAQGAVFATLDETTPTYQFR